RCSWGTPPGAGPAVRQYRENRGVADPEWQTALSTFSYVRQSSPACPARGRAGSEECGWNARGRSLDPEIRACASSPGPPLPSWEPTSAPARNPDPTGDLVHSARQAVLESDSGTRPNSWRAASS